MFEILSKFFPLFFYPIGIAGIAAVVSGCLALKSRPLPSAIFAFLSIGVLWFFSLPVTAHLLVRGIESQYNQPESFPQASAIVLLGGGANPPTPPRRYPEVNGFTGDRIMHAARLLRKGYAPVIIPTGGKLPFLHDFEGSEAGNMFMILNESFGVDPAMILIEDQSRNTMEHPPNVKRILAQHHLGTDIILVTSAIHMPRAAAVFRKAGYTVYPAPTDYIEECRFQWKFFGFLPNSSALDHATTAIHEYYGLLIYRLIGRI